MVRLCAAVLIGTRVALISHIQRVLVRLFHPNQQGSRPSFGVAN